MPYFIVIFPFLNAIDYAPFLFNGDLATICYMVYELLLANRLESPEEAIAYQEALVNGAFDFAAYPKICQKMNELIHYITELPFWLPYSLFLHFNL